MSTPTQDVNLMTNPKYSNYKAKYSGGGGAVKYMECLKNHAASVGGAATDGCGEFMAGGEDGSLEALKCSACNCHRNFHRKITTMHTSTINSTANDVIDKSVYMNPVTTAGTKLDEGGSMAVKKRYRTKFTKEQKERMYRFAEKAGWKITKVGDFEVKGFCQEIGIKRKVLKVWMHNNKYHLAKKINIPSPST